MQCKTFVANATTEVFERHLVRARDEPFSLLGIVKMTDQEVGGVASEQPVTQKARLYDRAVFRYQEKAVTIPINQSVHS